MQIAFVPHFAQSRCKKKKFKKIKGGSHSKCPNVLREHALITCRISLWRRGEMKYEQVFKIKKTGVRFEWMLFPPLSWGTNSPATTGRRSIHRPLPASRCCCSEWTFGGRRIPAWTSTLGTSSRSWHPETSRQTVNINLFGIWLMFIKLRLMMAVDPKMKGALLYLDGFQVHVLSSWPALIKKRSLKFSPHC